jgi:hypothetical protein
MNSQLIEHVATKGPTAAPASDDFSSDLRICHDALAAFPADGPLKPLRGPIVVVARAARNHGVTPERMIAELKPILFRLPQFEIRRAIDRGDMMHQLVTVAINAYYARPDD